MAQIKDLKRMCATYVDNDCDGCPLDSLDYCTHLPCNMSNNADEIVYEWVKEHPVKTYAMDFFEKFPNAPKDNDGEPRTCIKNIYGLAISHERCTAQSCAKCWNQEMKENA